MSMAVLPLLPLVTTVLVLNGHYGKIHDMFLTTIAVAVQSRYSYFWTRRGSAQFSTAMDIYGPHNKDT
jgi:hypothetical protein